MIKDPFDISIFISTLLCYSIILYNSSITHSYASKIIAVAIAVVMILYYAIED